MLLVFFFIIIIIYLLQIQKVLVGDKSDLDSKRQVTLEEATSLADKCHMTHLETSAKDSTNVEQLFQTLTSNLMSIHKERLKWPSEKENGTKTILGNSHKVNESSYCSC